MKNKPLSDQVVLITGASSGIGLLTARAAAGRGAKIMLVARGREALERAVRDIERGGGVAAFAVADVGSIDQLRAAAAQAVERFGRIDTWVSNAGVAIYASLRETPEDEHERLFRTNYFGTVNSALVAVERLRADGGTLIAVNSIAGDIPSPTLGAYTASKHAARAYLQSLRIELMQGDIPVAVSIIKPSGMATPIARHAANHLEGEARIPPPAYDPQLVADAILACAERPRREITVGGAGRAQVLFGTHFPALFERLATGMTALLVDPRTPKTDRDNLAHAGSDDEGTVESDVMVRHSAYTAAALHPAASWAALGVATLAGLALWRQRRRRS